MPKYELFLKNSSIATGIEFDGSPKELAKKFTTEKGFIEFESNYEDCPIFIKGEQIAGYSTFPQYKDGEIVPH